MKTLQFLVFFLCSMNLFSQENNGNKSDSLAPVYQFKMKDILGQEFDFGCLEGKKILIVNTGSKCMYGPQLHDLQKLYMKYKDSGFVVVAFPSNSFARREPDPDNEIEEKYRDKYGITFPVMAKSEMKDENINPLFDYLTNKVQNGINNQPVQWNFQKYLVNRNGFLSKVVEPKVKPFDDEIIKWIESEE
ncbi:MAG: glutathione peroxidase [Bacteroidales bacterium]